MLLRKKMVTCVAALVLLVYCSLLVAGRPKQGGKADALRDLGGVDRGGIPVMTVPAGPHYLTTPAGSSHVPIAVPANYFFEGSDAVQISADMIGVPIGAKPKRGDGFRWAFGRDNSTARPQEPYDTCMVQYQAAVLPTIGSEATVDLKLDIVRMRSPDLLTVTGASGAREYQVSLDLRPFHQEHGRGETMGWMKFARTGVATGKFSAQFHAWARYTFTPIDGGTPVVYDLDDQLTITVEDTTPTRFYIPALDNGTDVAEDVDVSGLAEEGPGEPCTGGCCCCKTEITPGGWHCPST
jgi:hypothetical protein